MHPVKILVVDDFEPFRRFLRPMLEQEPNLRIVGEAADGLEALQKIEELQPDLILLDIGLPRLNGMEVAVRAGELAPHARILFLTQEFSFDMVQEAFRLGVLGYVHKQRASAELLSAVETVLSGRPFVSGGLNDGNSAQGANVQTRRHEAVFCSDRAALLESLTSFIADAQRSGIPAIVIATNSLLDDILQGLRAQGLPVDAAIERGSFVPLEVNEVLSSFMVDDMPDPARFFKTSTALIDRVAKAAMGYHPRIAACGVCAPFLLAEGKVDAAIRLEQFWDQLAKAFKLDILCAYSMESFGHADDDSVLRSISAEHLVISSR